MSLYENFQFCQKFGVSPKKGPNPRSKWSRKLLNPIVIFRRDVCNCCFSHVFSGMLCVERFSDGVAFSYRCCQTPFGELRNPVQCMKILFFCQNFESDQNLDFAVWVSRIYICQQHVCGDIRM